MCLSPFAKRALFGLCLTGYLLPSPKRALVSVWPCRAILPPVPAQQTPIGRPPHALHRSRPYERGWEKRRHINQAKMVHLSYFKASRNDVLPGGGRESLWFTCDVVQHFNYIRICVQNLQTNQDDQNNLLQIEIYLNLKWFFHSFWMGWFAKCSSWFILNICQIWLVKCKM